MIGQTVSHYRIEQQLGEGGMGVVYKARDLRLDRPVALKFLPPYLVADHHAKGRFLREAKAASALDHPNICVVHSIDECENGELFIAMAYYAGETLAQKIQRGPLGVDEAIGFARQLAHGLATAHDRGIVHRDIKPANLMVTDGGLLKILDFGIASLAGATRRTDMGQVIGTVAYMSPEQLEGGEGTAQSDLWAWGVVLYEMLAGRLPFQGITPGAVLYAILNSEPPPLSEFRDDVPQALETVLFRALAKDRERRYRDMIELLSELPGSGPPRLSPDVPAPSGIHPRPVRKPLASAPLPFVTSDCPTPKGSDASPFVDRETELGKLQGWLEEALSGRGRIGFVSGEAGSGKTALAREFGRRAAEADAGLIVASGRCNAHTGIGDPCHPFREIVGLLTGDVEDGWAAGSLSADHATRLWNLLPTTIRSVMNEGPDLVGPFLPAADLLRRGESHPALGGQWLRALRRLVEQQRSGRSAHRVELFDQYVRVIKAVARERPLVLVVDDLQWADTGSAELLFQLGRDLAGSRILVLGLFRPTDIALGRGGERHPFDPVWNELSESFAEATIECGAAGDRRFVEALIDSEPNQLDAGFRDSLFEHTRGHALFTVELLRSMQEQGLLIRDAEQRWHASATLRWNILPGRVAAVIEERLAHLSPELHRLLSVASVEGEDFTLEAVAKVQGMEVRELLGPVSQDLEKRHRLVTAQGCHRIDGQRLSVYRFRHILFQQFLYERLDAVERAYLHEQLGEALETLHGQHREEIALKLARHFQAADRPDKAAEHHFTAGQHSLLAGGCREAVLHYQSSLDCLLSLPVSVDRDARELKAQLGLGNAKHLAVVPGQETAFQRARQLAEGLGDARRLGWALMGSYLGTHYSGNHPESARLAAQCLAIAEAEGDNGLRAWGCEAAGRSALMRGDLRGSMQHFQALLSRYNPDDVDPVFVAPGELGAIARGTIALLRMEMGYPTQAVEWNRDALAVARERRRPLALSLVLFYDVLIHLDRRDTETAMAQTEAWRAVNAEAGVAAFMGPLADLCDGRCRVLMGDPEEGARLTQAGLAALHHMGVTVGTAYLSSWVAQALALQGNAVAGLRILEEARAHPVTIDEMWREPDILHTLGSLVLALPEPDPSRARALFGEAIEVARAQEAKWYELRATTSLARLLREQDRSNEAREMLAAIYGWFTEGFDTADLKDAKALLEELGGLP